MPKHSNIGLTASTTRTALIARLGLPANTTEQGVDDHIMSTLCTKYGMPADATVDELEQRMFETHCRQFGISPTAPGAKEALYARLLGPRTAKAA